MARKPKCRRRLGPPSERSPIGRRFLAGKQPRKLGKIDPANLLDQLFTLRRRKLIPERQQVMLIVIAQVLFERRHQNGQVQCEL